MRPWAKALYPHCLVPIKDRSLLPWFLLASNCLSKLLSDMILINFNPFYQRDSASEVYIKALLSATELKRARHCSQCSHHIAIKQVDNCNFWSVYGMLLKRLNLIIILLQQHRFLIPGWGRVAWLRLTFLRLSCRGKHERRGEGGKKLQTCVKSTWTVSMGLNLTI